MPLLERDHGVKVNRKRMQRLRRKMGNETIWCRPRRTSIPDNGHRNYPYLLRDRAVGYSNEVWCADITYVPMPHGYAYLCAVMGWHSRKVLGRAVSNTMDAGLTQEALTQSRGLPAIFNTDQGSALQEHGGIQEHLSDGGKTVGKAVLEKGVDGVLGGGSFGLSGHGWCWCWI